MLSPYVNVDIKMSATMLRALSLYETFCVVQQKHTTTEDEIRSFLADRFSQKLADKFDPRFVFTAQDVLRDPP